MASPINLLEYAETLGSGGFTAEQARTAAHALGQAIDPQLVSLAALVVQGEKHERQLFDLNTMVKRRFDDVEHTMNERFAESERRTDLRLVESERKTELRFIESERKTELRFIESDHKNDVRFDQMDHKLEGVRAEFKVDLARLESKLIMWMVTILIVQSGTTALLFKLLH